LHTVTPSSVGIEALVLDAEAEISNAITKQPYAIILGLPTPWDTQLTSIEVSWLAECSKVLLVLK